MYLGSLERTQVVRVARGAAEISFSKVIKQLLVHAFSVRVSSYGCTWEVWKALKRLELLSAAPRATLSLLSCSPNFPRASITRYAHAKSMNQLLTRVPTKGYVPTGARTRTLGTGTKSKQSLSEVGFHSSD